MHTKTILLILSLVFEITQCSDLTQTKPKEQITIMPNETIVFNLQENASHDLKTATTNFTMSVNATGTPSVEVKGTLDLQVEQADYSVSMDLHSFEILKDQKTATIDIESKDKISGPVFDVKLTEASNFELLSKNKSNDSGYTFIDRATKVSDLGGYDKCNVNAMAVQNLNDTEYRFLMCVDEGVDNMTNGTTRLYVENNSTLTNTFNTTLQSENYCTNLNVFEDFNIAMQSLGIDQDNFDALKK